MIQRHSKEERYSAGRILFHALAIVSLVKNAASSMEDIISPRSKVQRNSQIAGRDITTPTFGACDSPADRLSCAITPSVCPDGDIYVNAFNLINIRKCDSPHRVEVGRCTSPDGHNHCSAFSTSCGSSSSYTQSDSSCSLVEDNSEDRNGLTQYPYCRKTIDGGNPLMAEHRCVLSGDECITGEEELLTLNQASKFMRCFCHVVPTGMCYAKDVEPITADSSYCAVASYDCKDGDSFMPGFELDERTDPPRTCRLCDVEDLQFYNLHKAVVQAGRCITKEGIYAGCHLESTACADPLEFQSSIELHARGIMACSADAFFGGDCESDQENGAYCTYNAEACAAPAKFTERSTCTIHSDSVNDEPMYFGQCKSLTGESSEGRDYRCVWQSSECDDTNEQYTPASKPMDWYDGCTCENVVTGACQEPNSGEYYCAVSELGCASGHTYITSLQTKSADLDCRLCQRSRIQKSADPTLSPIKSSPVNSPVTDTPTFSPTKGALTFPPTPTAMGDLFGDDDNGATDSGPQRTFAPTPTTMVDDDIDDNYDDDSKMVVSLRSFSPTPTAYHDRYQLDDDEFLYDDDDRVADDDVGQYDNAIIIAGSVGGTIVFTCIAILFYYRKPLPPVKLYRADDDKEVV